MSIRVAESLNICKHNETNKTVNTHMHTQIYNSQLFPVPISDATAKSKKGRFGAFCLLLYLVHFPITSVKDVERFLWAVYIIGSNLTLSVTR